MIADEGGAGVYMGPYVLNHAVVLEDIIAWTLAHRAENPGIAGNDMFLCNDPWGGSGPPERRRDLRAALSGR